MIDWMIQVFRVMAVSSDETYFLAVSIMDRYFIAKSRENIVLTYPDLHLIGIVCIFIASKYEDVEAITMNSLIDEIAHKKFSKT